MFKLSNIFLIFMLILGFANLSHAQQICYLMGKKNNAMWEDTNNFRLTGKGTIVTKGLTIAQDSFCPKEGYVLKVGARKYCITNNYFVGNFNNPKAFGACGRPGNVFTQECFDAQICLDHYDRLKDMGIPPHLIGDMCKNEAYGADASYLSNLTLDCNNLGDLDVLTNTVHEGPGKWEDSYGGRWTFYHGNKKRIFQGFVDTNTAYDGRARCGIWNITDGTIDGSGNIIIKAVNPNYPNAANKYCLKRFSFSGKVAGLEGTGLYTNAKNLTGPFTLSRLTPLPGDVYNVVYKSSRNNIAVLGDVPAPWFDANPTAIPTTTPPAFIPTPTYNPIPGFSLPAFPQFGFTPSPTPVQPQIQPQIKPVPPPPTVYNPWTPIPAPKPAPTAPAPYNPWGAFSR